MKERSKELLLLRCNDVGSFAEQIVAAAIAAVGREMRTRPKRVRAVAVTACLEQTIFRCHRQAGFTGDPKMIGTAQAELSTHRKPAGVDQVNLEAAALGCATIGRAGLVHMQATICVDHERRGMASNAIHTGQSKRGHEKAGDAGHFHDRQALQKSFWGYVERLTGGCRRRQVSRRAVVVLVMDQR